MTGGRRQQGVLKRFFGGLRRRAEVGCALLPFDFGRDRNNFRRQQLLSAARAPLRCIKIDGAAQCLDAAFAAQVAAAAEFTRALSQGLQGILRRAQRNQFVERLPGVAAVLIFQGDRHHVVLSILRAELPGFGIAALQGTLTPGDGDA